MRGIDENQMFNRGLATTLVVLAACFGLDHPVHAGWTQPEELADLDRKLAEADPEEAMGLRRERIVWREQHLEPDTSPAASGSGSRRRCAVGSSPFRIERLPSPLDVAFGRLRGTPNHSRLGSIFGPMECGRNGHAGSRDCSGWNSIPISKPILFFALTDPIWCDVNAIIVARGCGSWPSFTGCN